MIQKKDCQGVYYSAVKCKIVRYCDRNDFIYNFMKNIHSVEHEPVQKGKNIDLLAFSKGGGGGGGQTYNFGNFGFKI